MKKDKKYLNLKNIKQKEEIILMINQINISFVLDQVHIKQIWNGQKNKKLKEILAIK
jgi:hypothetical protein